jgi:hypothetical protein
MKGPYYFELTVSALFLAAEWQLWYFFVNMSEHVFY